MAMTISTDATPMEEMTLIELAVSSSTSDGWHRNHITQANHIEQYKAKTRPTQTLYRSHWRYPQAMADHVAKTGSVKGYNGLIGLDHVLIDIDLKDASQQVSFINTLRAWWLEYVMEWDLQHMILCSFSGTGFHLYLHKDAFDLEPSEKLPQWVGATVSAWWEDNAQMLSSAGFTFDPAMYRPMQVYRVMNSFNAKSKLHKILFDPIKADINEIIVSAAKNQHLIDHIHFEGNGELIEYTPDELPASIQDTKPTLGSAPLVGHCFHSLMSMGQKAKDAYGRHETVMRLATFFVMQSMPYQVAFDAIHSWCNTNLGDYDVNDTTRCIKSIYNGEYRYGCKDHILSSHCNKNCKIYKG